ncbi:MAG: ABC transporter ATP-binding protein [Eubacteriales bacterium]
MLHFSNLSVAYHNHPRALIDLNLHIQKGEIVSLVGESGSGKTTVLRAAMGLLPPCGTITGGAITLDGAPLLDLSEQARNRLRGTDLSMIFQDTGAMLNPIRTVGSQFVEYIRAHRKMPRQESWDLACEMLSKMGLTRSEQVMQSIPSQLSGGMRQRVGIAMAMTFQPKVLLADEPTSALDVTTQAQIVHQMGALRDQFGTTMVLSTHNLGVAAYISDRIVVMKGGQVVEMGPTDQLMGSPQTAYTRDLLHSIPVLGGKSYV